MVKDLITKDLKDETGAPVCEKCGNILIKESLSDIQNDLADSKDGNWVCPHCQGEINFLGDDDE